MSYTLSFININNDAGRSYITIRVNGDIDEFRSGGYTIAINGETTDPIEPISDEGYVEFMVATDLLPITFTILTAEGSTVPGSQLVAPPTESSSGGLSDGAIIGIILGSIVGLFLIYYYSYIKYFNLG